MQPLSIIAAFAFLGGLSMIGSLMVVMSSRRMLKTAGSPASSWPNRGGPRVQIMLTGNALLLTVGLAVLALGIRGIYRLIWVA